MKMGDIENLPGDAVTLWKEIYFPRLSGDEKAVLYCLKLLKLVHTPVFKEIVRGKWKIIFEKFVRSNELEQKYQSLLLFNLSYYYSQKIKESKTRAELSFNLEKGIKYIEEAIGIYKELGLKADLAHSLAISVFVFNDSIEFDANYFIKAAVNCDEAIKIFLDFGMVYKAKPLIPYGIRFHETLYKIDNEERHKQVIEFYKGIGS